MNEPQSDNYVKPICYVVAASSQLLIKHLKRSWRRYNYVYKVSFRFPSLSGLSIHRVRDSSFQAFSIKSPYSSEFPIFIQMIVSKTQSIYMFKLHMQEINWLNWVPSKTSHFFFSSILEPHFMQKESSKVKTPIENICNIFRPLCLLYRVLHWGQVWFPSFLSYS